MKLSYIKLPNEILDMNMTASSPAVKFISKIALGNLT